MHTVRDGSMSRRASVTGYAATSSFFVKSFCDGANLSSAPTSSVSLLYLKKNAQWGLGIQTLQATTLKHKVVFEKVETQHLVCDL
jgi:hypothetical protein